MCEEDENSLWDVEHQISKIIERMDKYPEPKRSNSLIIFGGYLKDHVDGINNMISKDHIFDEFKDSLNRKPDTAIASQNSDENCQDHENGDISKSGYDENDPGNGQNPGDRGKKSDTNYADIDLHDSSNGAGYYPLSERERRELGD